MAKRNLQIERLEDRQLLAVAPIDGAGNNTLHPTWGAAGADLLRTAPAQYSDGLSTPAGASRPDARTISNAVASETVALLNNRKLSAFIYAWGQFIDHDLDLTPGSSQPFNIKVPTGDQFFDPNATGTQVIPLNRSVHDPATGAVNARQQVNKVTSFVDGSMVYGSDATRAAALRTFVDGLLKTSDGNLLPLNTDGLPNANDAHRVAGEELFLAGDVRANENPELTSLHTLFVREHNRIAAAIKAAGQSLTDEQIYQQARARVIGEIQAITYNEWLPALLGTLDTLGPYLGYNSAVNPGIANEFSAAAFRLGHSLIADTVDFLDNAGEDVIPEMLFRDAFFNPEPIKSLGVDPVLKYLASDTAHELDNRVTDELRNFLFGEPGQGGLDLASLNIQRGRDHGLADYNSVRAAYGLPRFVSFNQITTNVALAATLRQIYGGNINNIDLWVGGLAETHAPGSSMGQLFGRIVADQFRRLRSGDRFWYERTGLSFLRGTTLATIIKRNTGVSNLQQNVFFFYVPISGRIFFRPIATAIPVVGVPFIQVQLLDSDGEVVETVRTGATGLYQFSGPSTTGTFTIRVVPRIPLVFGDVEVDVTRGGPITGINFISKR